MPRANPGFAAQTPVKGKGMRKTTTTTTTKTTTTKKAGGRKGRNTGTRKVTNKQKFIAWMVRTGQARTKAVATKLLNTFVDEGGKKMENLIKKYFASSDGSTSGNVRIEPATIIDNGQNKETITGEKRTVKEDPPLNPGSPNKGTPTSGFKDTLKGGGSLYRLQRMPQGSVLRSSTRIGSWPFPKQSVATPVKAKIYAASRQYTDTTGESPVKRLVKADAYTKKTVGLNQVWQAFIPAMLPSIAYSKIGLTREWSHDGSVNVEDSTIKLWWDQPGEYHADPMKKVHGKKTSYLPLKRTSRLTIQNLQKLLDIKIKVHFIQFKRQAPFPDAASQGSKGVINPILTMNMLYNSLTENSRISAPEEKFGTAVRGTETNTQQIWGLSDAESKEYKGSYSCVTQYPTTVKRGEAFDDYVNVIKSMSFSCGAGCSREIDLELLGKVNFGAYGNFNQRTPVNADDSRNPSVTPNVDINSRVFYYIEICGQKDVNYYQLEKGTDNRVFSTAESGPAVFTMDLEMGVEMAILPRKFQDVSNKENGGLPYKQTYISIYNEDRIDREMNVDFNKIYQTETELNAGTNDYGYIIPVNTPENTIVGAGAIRVSE